MLVTGSRCGGSCGSGGTSMIGVSGCRSIFAVDAAAMVVEMKAAGTPVRRCNWQAKAAEAAALQQQL